MSPAKKLQIATDMYYEARRLKAAAVRQKHPDWLEEQVQGRVKEVFIRAQS
ncbi:MAG: hypothetical protein ACOC0A_00910 [Planctomycetota bacterium]